MSDDRDGVRQNAIKNIAHAIIDTLAMTAPDVNNSELLNGTGTALWWMCQAILDRSEDEDERETNRGEMEHMVLALWKRLHLHKPGATIQVKH